MLIDFKKGIIYENSGVPTETVGEGEGVVSVFFFITLYLNNENYPMFPGRSSTRQNEPR